MMPEKCRGQGNPKDLTRQYDRRSLHVRYPGRTRPPPAAHYDRSFAEAANSLPTGWAITSNIVPRRATRIFATLAGSSPPGVGDMISSLILYIVTML
ncbi:hypothetical protein B9Z19DRAFT_1091516 [Tuber borchii]|uniref:Uncharacterized protein n=1 Tax=Tuber borchii TaxID=42251 RepID=A0A2T6ZHD7_TUBBO|nr:hypothetical protein B9Z19DRAFT_1091516 [Tuber borchii]